MEKLAREFSFSRLRKEWNTVYNEFALKKRGCILLVPLDIYVEVQTCSSSIRSCTMAGPKETCATTSKFTGSGKRKLTDAPRRVVSNMMDNLTCMVECTPFPSEHHTLPVIIPGLSFSSTKGKMWAHVWIDTSRELLVHQRIGGWHGPSHVPVSCNYCSAFFLEIQQLSTIFEAPN